MTRPHYLTEASISAFITSALREDIGESDYSSLGAVPAESRSRAGLLAKEEGIVAGLELAERIFQAYDKNLSVSLQKRDGEKIRDGDIALFVAGNAQSILSTERLVLNCIQRMSGIATHTHKLCKLVEGTKVQLLDTRKTTPNFRIMEKWAVLIGGGRNHRFGLSEKIILKDNHIDMAGGVEVAIKNIKKYLQDHKKDIKIEVEVRNMEEVKQAVRAGGVDVLMLDNMDISEIKKAVKWVGKRVKIEASGGVNESNLRQIANCGVDFISIGMLTHSVPILDMSLLTSKKISSVS